MADVVEDNNDDVLSDVEADDLPPISSNSPLPDHISVDKFREVLAELDREKQARNEAENSKSELQVSFNRLKVLAHEAIKKRDEASRQRDEALKRIEGLSSALSGSESKFEDLMRVKELGRTEIETASSMLVSGIDKISNKVSSFRKFEGLPKSQKYTTGLPAVAYGVIKRTNEIVEELVRVVEVANKGRNEAREAMEQRNYEIAIEVSELEAAIGSLREEGVRKSEEIEKLEKSVKEGGERVLELEREMENEVGKLRSLVGEYENRVSSLETKMESQRVLVIDQLDYVAKIHQEMLNVIKVVDPRKSLELSELLFVAQETDAEENIRASMAGLESIYDLSIFVVEKTRDSMEEKKQEVKRLNETLAQLSKEKEQVGSLLRSAMSRKMAVDPSAKTNELYKVAENGLKEVGVDYQFSNHTGKRKPQDSSGAMETEDHDVYELAGALENIIKQSQVEIIDLKHTVEELRAESSVLKEQVEALEKELSQCKQRVRELEEKERMANENVEGLMLDIAAAEEEITRWKVAAQEEAAAGKAVEEECTEQLFTIRRELEEAKQAEAESERKLKFKEETAAAAMAARDAAEMSLKLADMRSTRLREKVEELTRQLEERDSKETSRTGSTRSRYMCWPWQWLGVDFVGFHRPDRQLGEGANEMELSEPLL
ncbi:hypothetical protein Leryth_016179 [Lithospermum erythrorhizon]|nr:hypothetical protein Leryth_016179 [Lithospermum erythrorhizon]